jgi:hypothetical protein
VITHVWSEQTVNLEVSKDGSYTYEDAGENFLPTSVTYNADKNAEGHHWHWPHDCEKKDETDLIPASQ